MGLFESLSVYEGQELYVLAQEDIIIAIINIRIVVINFLVFIIFSF